MLLHTTPQCSHIPGPNATTLKVPTPLHSRPYVAALQARACYQLSASTAPLSPGQAEAPLKRKCEDIIRYKEEKEDGYAT